MLRHVPALSAHLRGRSSRRAPAQPDLLEPVLIRSSRVEDRAALERLAALDSRELADGAFLLAEVEGELVAAAALDRDEEPLSDPFRPTATVRDLLRLRARQIRQSQARVAVAKTRSLPREAT